MTAVAAVVAGLLLGAQGWRPEAPLPLPRSEVAAAVVGDEIVVVGGFAADGTTSSRVDAYRPSAGTWRRLPDLPAALNHAFAAAWRGRIYVAGGSGENGRSAAAWMLVGTTWRRLPPLPYGLAAGGAAVLGGKLYLVGGVAGQAGERVLVRRMLVLDLSRPDRWRFAPGPSPREHLGVAAAGGRLIAIGGRAAGIDTNTALVETWKPGARAWMRVAPVPEPRGGTGAAAVGGTVVSVGGEAPSGTIASVYAYELSRNRWRRLEELPTPRHGVAVAALGGRVYVIGGGTVPGLSVSDANESLTIVG